MSSEKTTELDLHKWAPTDYVQRTEFNDNFVKLDEHAAQVTTQLAQVGDKTNREIVARLKRQTCIVSFIDDDGRLEFLTKWKPIIEEYGITVCIAVVTGWVENNTNPLCMTWTQLHDLRKRLGVELLNHTHTHPNLATLTEAQVIEEFETASRILKREGCVHDIMVYPFGGTNETVIKTARNYFRAAFNVNEGTVQVPVETFNMKRISLGEAVYTTWEQYKAVIDDAIAKNEWIVFKSHSQYTTFDANQIALIKQIITYLRANGVPILGMHDALDIYGNILDAGYYTGRAQNAEYTIIDCNGILHSQSNQKQYIDYAHFKSRTIDAPITAFALSTETVDLILSGSVGFPTTAGTLKTRRGRNDSYSFQLYYPHNNNAVHKRRWDATNKVWLPFELISSTSSFSTSPLLTTDIQAITANGKYYAGAVSSDKPTTNNCFVDAQIYNATNKTFVATIQTSGVRYTASLISGAWSGWDIIPDWSDVFKTKVHSGNLTAITDNGTHFTSSTQKPSGTSNGFVEVKVHNTYSKYEFTDVVTGDIYRAISNNTVMGVWRKLAFETQA